MSVQPAPDHAPRRFELLSVVAPVFNEDATIDHIAGFSSYGSNINNPFNGADGKLVRLALGLSFNRADIYEADFGMNAKTSKKYINYCAPITCSNAKNPLYADKSITGAWDPLANSGNGAYVAPKCGTSSGQGGDGQNNTAIEDAEALIEAAGYSHSNQLDFTLTSSTASFRNEERAYLAQCWDALQDNNGSMVHVDQSSVPAYYSSCADGGVRCNGYYEAGLIGFGGSPADPDFWKSYLLSSNCSRTLPTGSNNDCIDNTAIDNAFADETGNNNQSQVAADFATISETMVKNAYWIDTELRVDIRTWDEIHPAKGWSLNSFNAADTWNVFKWS
jgi:ABC-type oligopeptide transport system substrate-binding subunit